jgi:hypothetical protein
VVLIVFLVPSLSTRSSKRGSPETSASTTSLSVPATPPPGPELAPLVCVLRRSVGSSELRPHRHALWDEYRGCHQHPPGAALLAPSRRSSSPSAPVLALQRKDREIALHGYESGRIVRLPGGEYVEVHEQLDDYERWSSSTTTTTSPSRSAPTIRANHGGNEAARQEYPAGSLKTGFSRSRPKNSKVRASTNSRTRDSYSRDQWSRKGVWVL